MKTGIHLDNPGNLSFIASDNQSKISYVFHVPPIPHLFMYTPPPTFVRNYRENIHSLILKVYGDDCIKEIRMFEKLQTKIMKQVVDLNFLKYYRDSQLLPSFT
jgi:hypothetical protein